MPDRVFAPVVPDLLQPDRQELHPRVAELEASLQQCQDELETLGHRASRLNTLHQAVLDIAALRDESTLHQRIQEWAVRLLDASNGILDLGELGSSPRRGQNVSADARDCAR